MSPLKAAALLIAAILLSYVAGLDPQLRMTHAKEMSYVD